MKKIILKAKIRELRDNLKNTDYQVLKCYEATLTFKEMPYDLNDLIKKRDAWRIELNTAEEQLAVVGDK